MNILFWILLLLMLLLAVVILIYPLLRTVSYTHLTLPTMQ
mgnify:CR=1 FL=1